MSEPEQIADAFDGTLDRSNEKMEAGVLALRERNRQLQRLLAEKEALVKNLESTWQAARRQRRRIDAEIEKVLGNA